jgi:glycosyltransferase involved in cell wall biosynthesis
MSRNYIRGLSNRGYRVGVESIRGTMEISEEERSYFNNKRKLIKDNNGVERGIPYLNPNQISVVAHLPLWNIPKFKQNIIYSMMESKDTNKPFIERCNHYYDRCWTPTEYNKKDFQKNGMKIPISVMPIGVDDIYFNKEYVIENMSFNFKVFSNHKAPEQPEGFKFLSVFRWSFRKGFDVLIKSFLDEFSKKDNVSLIIFSRHAAMSHSPKFVDAIELDIINMLKEHPNKDHAPIYWCHDYIEQELMPSMYNIGDCFVSTSRGEGFSIPTLEASQMGLPVIAPFHTGFTDYITDENSYIVPVDEWVVCNDIPEWSGWITRDFYGQQFPRFGKKTLEIVSGHMRSVFTDYQSALKKNLKMKEVIQQKYTWEKCLDSAEREIKELL